MSKLAKNVRLPKGLTPKSTTFQQTAISRSLRKRALATSLSLNADSCKSVPFPIDIKHFCSEINDKKTR
ncbi:hypothetical protein P5673_021028 [Acropora cervicornis]|uniref:Uncharacterized protein n=1 Tax=Acropora cervicornis TaxID=6130 RepID=A0AAD9V0I4_ACRCE|nr:hypothetical protein P5673_021028 [Acropora cervicornis]